MLKSACKVVAMFCVERWEMHNKRNILTDDVFAGKMTKKAEGVPNTVAE